MFGYLSKFKYVLLQALAAPATPAAGLGVVYLNAAKQLCYKDDAGLEHVVCDVAQAQGDTVKRAVAAGTADALTASLTPAPTLTDGMRVFIRAASANATATPTLNLNGGGAVTITKLGGLALEPGDIAGSDHELIFAYNTTGPKWELLNPAGSFADFTGDPTDNAALVAWGAGLGGGGGGGGGYTRLGQATITGHTTYAGASTPYDNTTPLFSEGVDMPGLSVTVTPTSTTDKLKVRVYLSSLAASGSVSIILALYRDGNFCDMILLAPAAGTYTHPVVLEYEVVAGSTAATTFTVRVGGSSSTTVHINGYSGGDFGNVMQSRTTVDQFTP